MSPPATSLHVQQDENSTALLIIDMMSRWDYPDAEKVRAAAHVIAPTIAALKLRCARAGVPVIYANDNAGRWQSDWRSLVDDALGAGGEAAAIAEQLAPGPTDYFVLKPMHSAFFATPLNLLLQHLKVRRLILTGVTSDQCVLATAAGARMERYDIVVPRDAVATQTSERARAAVWYFKEVLCVPTPTAAETALS